MDILLRYWNIQTEQGVVSYSLVNVKSETLSISFLYSVILKSIALPCNLNGSFNHTWFYKIISWSFGKSGLPRYTDFYVNKFHYTISKNHIC